MCRCRHRDDTAGDSGPGTSEKPGCHPIHNLDRGARTTTTRLQSNGPTAGLKTDTELPPMGSVVINVQGATFDLPIPDADVLDRAAYMATEYCNLLTRTPSAPANPVELRTTLQPAGFFISDEKLKRDITHWRNAGTLETVIEDHHARHRGNCPNEERAMRYLANDPRFNIVRQIINTEGGHIDTLPNFVRIETNCPIPPHANPPATGLL